MTSNATNTAPFSSSGLLAHIGGGHLLPSTVPGETRIEVPLQLLPAACGAASNDLGGRLATMVGEDRRVDTDAYRLSYVFATPAQTWLTIEAAVDPATLEFPSVMPLVPAANWYEREVRDLLGLIPVGHPDPRRLVLHDNWPDGVYPLRKDFDPATPVPRVEREPRTFHKLHGDGINEIPVGPIHAGVIEPGHFRFATVGEVVLHLETQLFYTHRGIEKLAEGRSAAAILPVAERICGACSLSHSVTFSQAVETLAGSPAPPRAAAIRTIYLELERLYNHIGDLGNICAGVGFAPGVMFGAKLKDNLQRLNERLSGNRFLHGVCRVGGVRRDLSRDNLIDIETTLTHTAQDFSSFISLVLGSESTMERFTGTGILTNEIAREFAAVGVAARSSGIDIDSRRDHPHAFYTHAPMALPVIVRHEGDVKARFLTRIDEVLVSFALVRSIVANLPDGPLALTIDSLPPNRSAFAVTESPRGENLHWVRTGPDGMIERYRIRSASFPNWPAVATTAAGNMIPDFPLINKSFELCYACLDR